MRVLGIDCGSRSTGFAILESDGRRHKVLGYGAIRPTRCKTFADRLHYIHQELERLLEKHQPTVVAVEQVFQAFNVKSAQHLSQVRGVVLLVAASAGLPVAEYSATKVKTAVVGYGRAQKNQVQLMVQKILRLKEQPEPHDAADALAVALCHVQNQTFQPRASSK